ncbi:hypothetical protein [Streptomyces sp. NPDC093149]|uniref:hypothetical protein n=1 Tax=Streptomyces sp. NPDC093149 TaxID=3366031 RepID=UPI00382D4BA9
MVPVEFLTDAQAAACLAFDGAPSRTELERFFFLMDTAVDQLRADGFDVRDEDVAQLSPFVRQRINMLATPSSSPTCLAA